MRAQSLNHHQPLPEFCTLGHSIFKEDCKACVGLKKEWYCFLKKTGFEDLEVGIRLLRPAEQLNLRIDFQSQVTYHAKRDYYQWAQECLTTCSFDSMVDRLIWQHHAEGYTTREISPIVGHSQPWITRKIHSIEDKIKSR